MKNQYNGAQKAAIMTLLERNGGNVTLTAQQTGIPYLIQCLHDNDSSLRGCAA